MPLERLDLNLLRVFDVIYNERSLTRAASILHISQPAVSNALNRLRETLHDPLFIRERRGMSPTPAADSLAPAVQNALELLRSGLSSLEAFSPERAERTFRLSINDHVEAMVLPSLVLSLTKLAPNISILNNFVGRHELAREMAEGAVDIAVDVPVPADERLRHVDLIGETSACLVRPRHPVTRGKLTLARYLELGHVHVSGRRHGLGYIDKALAEYNRARLIKVRVRNPGLAAVIVKSTDYAMSVPERFAHLYELRALKLPFDVPPLAWRVYWPTRLDHDPGNTWLRNLIIEIANQYRFTHRGITR